MPDSTPLLIPAYIQIVSVISVHGGVHAAADAAFHGLRRLFTGRADVHGVLVPEHAQDPVGHVVIRMGRGAHPDLYPGKGVGAQAGDDALEAVVSPGGAAAADAQLPQGEGHVVRHHQHPLRRDLVKGSGGGNGIPGEIHIGLGLHQQHGLVAQTALGGEGLKAQPGRGDAGGFFQDLRRHEAHVVAGHGIFRSGIAQAYHQPGHPGGPGTKEHGQNSSQRAAAALPSVQKGGDGDLLVDPDNGLREQVRYGEIVDLVAHGTVLGIGDGIQEEQLLDGAFLNAVQGRAGEDAVAGAGKDLLGAAQIHQGLGRAAQAAGSVHHVVQEDDGLAPDVADDVHDLGLVGALPPLVHNGHVHAHLVGKEPDPGHAAHIGGDHHYVLIALAVAGEEEVGEQRRAQEVIHGNVEKALDLVGVEVHGEDPVCPGCGEQIGHQLGGDGVTGLGLAVLTGIAEVWNDGGNASGRSAAAGVNHDQKFHEIVVDGFTGGLDQEHVGTTDGLLKRYGGFAVSKVLHNSFAHGKAELLADGFGKLGVGIAADNLDVLTVSNHRMNPSL